MYCFGYFCRICIHNTKKLITLDIVLSDKNISLYEMMMEIKPELLQLDVIIPKYICTKCQKDLIISYSFHKRCQSAYENINKYIAKLNNIIQNPIKMITSESNKPFQFGYNEVTSRHMLFKIKKLTTQRLKSKKSNFKSLSIRSNLTAISTNYSKTLSNAPTLVLQNAQQLDLNNTIQKLVKSINIPNLDKLDDYITKDNLFNKTLKSNNLDLQKSKISQDKKCAINNIDKTDQNTALSFTAQNNYNIIHKQISPQNELNNDQNNLNNEQITNQNVQKPTQSLDQNDLIDLDKMFYETFNITDDYFVKEENALDLGSCEFSDISSSSISLIPLVKNDIKTEIQTENSNGHNSTDIDTQTVDLLPPTTLKRSNSDIEQIDSNNFEVKSENILANVTNNNFVDCSSSSKDKQEKSKNENYHNMLNLSNCSKIIAYVDLTISSEVTDNLSQPDEIKSSPKKSNSFKSEDIINYTCIDLTAPKNLNRIGHDCKKSNNVQDVSKNVQMTSTVREDCINLTLPPLESFNNTTQKSKISDSEMVETNLDFDLTGSYSSKIIPEPSKSIINSDISNSWNYCQGSTNKSYSTNMAKPILNEDIADFNSERSKIYHTSSCSENTSSQNDDMEISNYGINGNIDDYSQIKKDFNIFNNLLNLNESISTISNTSLSPGCLNNQTKYDIDTKIISQYNSYLSDSVDVLNTSISKDAIYKDADYNNSPSSDNIEVLNTSIIKEIGIKQDQIDKPERNKAKNLIVDFDISEHDYVYPNFYVEDPSDTACNETVSLTSENHLESELDIKEHSLSYNTEEMQKIKIEFEKILQDELKTDSLSSKTDSLKLNNPNIEVEACKIPPIFTVAPQSINKRKLENNPSNFTQQTCNSKIISNTNFKRDNSSSKNTAVKVELERTHKILKAAHKTMEESKILLSKKLNDTISTSANTQEDVIVDSSSIVANSINAKTATFKKDPNVELRNVSTSDNIVSKDSKYENSDIVSKPSDLKIVSEPKKSFKNSNSKATKSEILDVKTNTKKMNTSDLSNSTIVNKLDSEDQTINKLNPQDQKNQVSLKDSLVKNNPIVKSHNPEDIESKKLKTKNPEHLCLKKTLNIDCKKNEKKTNLKCMSPETLNSEDSNFKIKDLNDPKAKVINQKVQETTNSNSKIHNSEESNSKIEEKSHLKHFASYDSQFKNVSTRILSTKNTKPAMENKNTEESNHLSSKNMYSKESSLNDKNPTDPDSKGLVPKDSKIKNNVFKASESKNVNSIIQENKHQKKLKQIILDHIDLTESESNNSSSNYQDLNHLNPIDPDSKNINVKSKEIKSNEASSSDANSNCKVLSPKETDKSSNKLSFCKEDPTNSNIIVISSNLTVPKNVETSKASTSRETNVFVIHSCRYCRQTFKSRYEIKVHIFNSHKEMYNECQKCCRTFSTIKRLNDHKQKCYLDTPSKRHYNSPDFRGVNLQSYGHRNFEKFDHRFRPYENYSVRNTNNRSETVQFRNECFGSANTIRNNNYENETVSNLCCYCNLTFYSEAELKQHYFSKHYGSYRTYF